MKKLLLIALFAIASLTASAQCWIGGTAGLSIVNSKLEGLDSSTTVDFGLSPEIGYWITDRFAVAAELGVAVTSNDGTFTNFAIGPYARYKFTNNDRVNFFTDFAIHYSMVKAEDDDALNGFNIKLRPGISVNIGKNWDLIGRINLLEYDYLSDDGYTITGFGFKISSGLDIGFVYNF